MPKLRLQYLLSYKAYTKLQDASKSIRLDLPADKRTVNINKVVTNHGELLVTPTGGLHSNIYDSHVSCFIFTPIEEWHKPILKEFRGEAWDYKSYVGLVFICRDRQYVISGSTNIKLDIANVDFETNIACVREHERKQCATGMGWRAHYFQGNLPEVLAIGKAVYCYYSDDMQDRALYCIHIRTPKGLVDYYLGDSPACIEKLHSIINIASSSNTFVDHKVNPAISPPELTHSYSKVFSKDDQLALF